MAKWVSRDKSDAPPPTANLKKFGYSGILTDTRRFSVFGPIPVAGWIAPSSLFPEEHVAGIAVELHLGSASEVEGWLSTMRRCGQSSARNHCWRRKEGVIFCSETQDELNKASMDAFEWIKLWDIKRRNLFGRIHQTHPPNIHSLNEWI